MKIPIRKVFVTTNTERDPDYSVCPLLTKRKHDMGYRTMSECETNCLGPEVVRLVGLHSELGRRCINPVVAGDPDIDQQPVWFRYSVSS